MAVQPLKRPGFVPKPKMTLPTTKTSAPQDMSGYTSFIYGSQKIGKTSLTAAFPNSLHFFFEPSGTDYELFAVEPTSWDEFTSYIDALEAEKAEGKARFKTFTIDVVDLAYEMCLKAVCGKQGLDYPPQNDFGKTWKEIKDEFRQQMIRLARLGGIFVLSHVKETKIETRDGGEYTVFQPSCAKGAAEVLSKWADLTAFYRVADDGSRELCITPDIAFEAGNRMESRFKFTDGTQISAIPMGSSAKEAHANFMAAFHNKMERKADAQPTTPKTSEGGNGKPAKKLAIKPKGR